MITKITPRKHSCSARLGIVKSVFNHVVTQRLEDSARNEIERLSDQIKAVTWVDVAGAVEIPIVLQRLARTKQYDALIAYGAVIRGQTSHYDYVCEQVSRGCQQISLQYDIPVIFKVVTVENLEQALSRTGGEKCDMGREGIQVALEMTALLEELTD